MNFGPAILGDNQFLGVNHYSTETASSHFRTFADSERILEVIGWAYESGIRDFMFTTHERFEPVFAEALRSNLFPGLRYIPCLPYAHKYASAMAEKGMLEVVLQTLRGTSKRRLLSSAFRSVLGDFGGVMRLLVQVDLLMCRGLNVGGVFLQNVLFDLLMGLHAKHLIADYHRFVTDELGVVPGYITMNHPTASRLLHDELGLRGAWVCSNFNKNGFRTHPSLAEVTDSFASRRTRNIAMSVFAPGPAGPAESLEFVTRSAGVDAVLFGSTRRNNIGRNAATIVGGRVARQVD